MTYKPGNKIVGGGAGIWLACGALKGAHYMNEASSPEAHLGVSPPTLRIWLWKLGTSYIDPVKKF